MLFDYAIGADHFQDVSYLAHIWPKRAFGVGWVVFIDGPSNIPLGVKYALIRLHSGRYLGIRKTHMLQIPEALQDIFSQVVRS